MSLNVSLTPELEEYMSSKVQSGNYTSAGEVVREGLRLLRDYDELRVNRLEAVRAHIEKGWQDSENGRVITPEAVADQIRLKSEHRRKKRA
jgi:antitoxin ParD1/3/4